ncbi:hypothetical protein MPSEU_000436000 [Mayamaea pseudoterrestris]|nr:hypothetical protein MPSEU_000436000 [Mayamaea pseudoterrestris]
MKFCNSSKSPPPTPESDSPVDQRCDDMEGATNEPNMPDDLSLNGFENEIDDDDDSQGSIPPPPPNDPHPDDLAEQGIIQTAPAVTTAPIVEAEASAPPFKKARSFFFYKQPKQAKSKRDASEATLPPAGPASLSSITSREFVNVNDDDDPDVYSEQQEDERVSQVGAREYYVDDDDYTFENASVEIPPTSVLQRYKARESDSTSKKTSSKRWCAILIVGFLLLLIIILAVGFGTGAFVQSASSTPSDSNNGSAGSGNPNHSGSSGNNTWMASNSTSTNGRPGRLLSFLSDLTDANAFQDITSPQSLALAWLVNDDPLQLDPAQGKTDDQFRVQQRFALLTLWYSSQQGWKNETNWLQDLNECTWYGITCGARSVSGIERDNVVIAIGMDDNNVQGLPNDVVMLEHLEILSLPGNALDGTLPESLTRMISLVELHLDNNAFEQSLYNFDWSPLINLEVLRLSENKFSGVLSDSLWTLTKLEELILDNNEIFGELASAIGNLASLKVIDLGFNAFFGSLPATIGGLTKLSTLRLGNNEFSGAIPSSITGMTSLQELNIEANRLTGTLPENLVNLDLSILLVGRNSFSQGSIPSFVYELTSLEVLGLNEMQLTGQIDTTIGNLVNLRELYMESNFLAGILPVELASCTELNTLTMQNNFFSGDLSFATSLTNMVNLNLAKNQLVGGVPDVGALSSLTRLQLQENEALGGTLPESLTLLQSLVYLDLSATSLSGSLPSTLGKNWPAMEDLLLFKNRFSGSIPKSICDMANLRTLRLQENVGSSTGDDDATFSTGLSGPLPKSIGNLSNLEVLELQSNRLTGQLPRAMRELTQLIYLDIEDNEFIGDIPSQFARMESLQEFYLSGNNIQGSMPQGICQLSNLQSLVPDCGITECSCCTSCA